MIEGMKPFPDVDDPARDATVVDGNGVEVRLSSLWADRTAVLVFLRYFGCPFCQAQVVKLRRDRERFDATGAQIVMIGQGAPGDCGEFCDPSHMPFTVLFDPDRTAFDAYELGHVRPLQVLKPQVALPWLRLQFHAETRQRGLHGGSFMQLAGTFVIDQTGLVRLARRSRHIADSPGNQVVLDLLWRSTVGPTLAPGTDPIASTAERIAMGEIRKAAEARRSPRP